MIKNIKIRRSMTGYVIRDEFDQTTKAVIVGVENSEEAMQVALDSGVEAYEDPSDLYVAAVVPVYERETFEGEQVVHRSDEAIVTKVDVDKDPRGGW